MSNTKISSKGGSDQLGIYRPNTSAATSLDVGQAASSQPRHPGILRSAVPMNIQTRMPSQLLSAAAAAEEGINESSSLSTVTINSVPQSGITFRFSYSKQAVTVDLNEGVGGEMETQ